MKLSEHAEYFLRTDPDDWRPAAALFSSVDDDTEMPSLLKELLENDLAQIGEITHDREFSVWAGSSVALVERALLTLRASDDLNRTRCFWINLTDAGYETAQRLAASI